MQVTETLNDGLRRGYTITVPASDLEAKVDAKLAEAQPTVEMKGFRKGKVPLPLLKKQFGQRLMGEAMQESVDGAMSKHFEDTGDRPAMQPKVEMANQGWKPGDDVEVALSYEALPEVPEVDFSDVAVERLVVEPEEAEVEDALRQLAATAPTFAPKEGAAEDGDQVAIDFVGRLDGEPFEGGAAEDYPLRLGSNSFIPGFEEQLVGVTAGEEREVAVSFPEDYNNEALKGRDAVFAVTVREVRSASDAPLDDALAKRFGAEDLAGLRAQIAERLKGEYAGAARQVLKRRLLDQLDGKVSFALPPSLLEAEASQIAHSLWHEDHPDVDHHDHGTIEPTAEHRTLAERRVRLGLLLADIGQKAAVEVTDQEMTQAVMTQARQFPGREREYFQYVQGNQGALTQIRAPLFEEKVVDHILEQATVTDRGVTKDELKAEVDALEAEEKPAAAEEATADA